MNPGKQQDSNSLISRHRPWPCALSLVVMHLRAAGWYRISMLRSALHTRPPAACFGQANSSAPSTTALKTEIPRIFVEPSQTSARSGDVRRAVIGPSRSASAGHGQGLLASQASRSRSVRIWWVSSRPPPPSRQIRQIWPCSPCWPGGNPERLPGEEPRIRHRRGPAHRSRPSAEKAIGMGGSRHRRR